MWSKFIHFLLIVVLIEKSITYKLRDLTEEKYSDRLAHSGFLDGKYDVSIEN